MTRQQLDSYITEKYSSLAEYPWASAPSFAVYRHENNKKWFAVIMDISRLKLGQKSDQIISVVNLKVEMPLIGQLMGNDGIYPAYHMNKNHWITVELTDKTSLEQISWLLEMSYNLTNVKVINKAQKE